jgi:hypothetical protein
MISKLTYGNSVFGILSYNEDKVKSGEAKPILAENFSKDLEELSFADKHQNFKNFTDLNTRTKRNAYHFALSFSPNDQTILTPELKKNIAKEYMEGIGLKDQPYLVYEHFDTDHPHMHIVTTNINSDGERIDIYRQVHKESENIRKQIEVEYNLTIAEKSEISIEKTVLNDRLKYGKQPTKSSLSKAVNLATNEFKPTTLNELKSSLSHYGIRINEGAKGSIQEKNKGLVYSFMDQNGEQIGKGIKASSLTNRPTLTNLYKVFSKNKVLKKEAFKPVASAVNEIFHNSIKFTEKGFIKQLNDKNILAKIDRNEHGDIREINYTDLKTGAIFNSNEFKLDQVKLREKFGDYSLSKSEASDISKLISSEFRKSWRESKQVYESSYFLSIDKNSLLERIMVDNPNTNNEIIKDSFSNFLDYKEQQQLAIFEKDIEKFRAKNVGIIRYISSPDFEFNVNDKSLFLNQFNLNISEDDGKTTISHKQDGNIRMVLPQEKEHLLRAKNEPNLSSQINFTPADKRLLYYLSERKNEHDKVPKDVNLYLYKKKNIAPFITEKDVKFIETSINRDYGDKLTSLIKKGDIKSVQELMDFGLIIEPLSDSKKETNFIMRYHDNKREYAVPVKGNLRDFIIEKGYNNAIFKQDYNERFSTHYDNFNLKYRLVSNLNRIGITKSYNGLVYAHNIISKRNSVAGNNISAFVEKTYNSKGLSTNQQYENIRVHTLNVVKNISDVEIGKDHLEQNKNKVNDKKLNITGSAGIAMIKESNFEEEKRRKKLLKDFYNELEK